MSSRTINPVCITFHQTRVHEFERDTSQIKIQLYRTLDQYELESRLFKLRVLWNRGQFSISELKHSNALPVNAVTRQHC